jgi:hypothetical protein
MFLRSCYAYNIILKNRLHRISFYLKKEKKIDRCQSKIDLYLYTKEIFLAYQINRAYQKQTWKNFAQTTKNIRCLPGQLTNVRAFSQSHDLYSCSIISAPLDNV